MHINLWVEVMKQVQLSTLSFFNSRNTPLHPEWGVVFVRVAYFAFFTSCHRAL